MVTGSADLSRRGTLADGPPSFHFRRIDAGDAAYDDAARLRFEVYCRECRFLVEADYPDGREGDEFDAPSIHFAGSDVADKVVGTLRLVRDSERGFPLEGHLQQPLPLLPRGRTAEISRLIVARRYRQCSVRRGREVGDPPSIDCAHSYPAILFGLFREMYGESLRQGLEFWLAAMEPGLWRWLRRFGFVFHQIGKPIEYFGEVVPYVARIGDIRKQVTSSRPDVLKFFQPEAG